MLAFETNPTPAPDGIDGLLTESIDAISPFMGISLTLMGIAMAVWGGVLCLKKIMDSRFNQDSWVKVIILMVMGGAFAAGGFVITPKKDAEPGIDGSSSTPPPGTPIVPPSNPIALPKIENPEILWIIPVALILMFTVYFIARQIKKDHALSRQKAIEQAAKDAEINAEKLRVEKIVAEHWQMVVDEHTKLRTKFLKSETDWDLLFKYPALQDVAVPQTASMIRAMNTANNTDPSCPPNLTEDTDISQLAYPRAVGNFAIAWRVATEHARMVGQKYISREDRKRIKLIRTLLNIVEDGSASETERGNAYTQVQRLLKQLDSVKIPKKALLAIEERQQLALTALPSTGIAL